MNPLYGYADLEKIQIMKSLYFQNLHLERAIFLIYFLPQSLTLVLYVLDICISILVNLEKYSFSPPTEVMGPMYSHVTRALVPQKFIVFPQPIGQP